MSEEFIMQIILNCGLIILVTLLSVYFIISDLNKNKNQVIKQDFDIKLIEYNEKILTFLKTIIVEECIIEFEKIQRKIKDPSKINFNTLMSSHISDVSKRIYENLEIKLLKEHTLMKESFYYDYIIQNVTIHMSKLLNKFINE